MQETDLRIGCVLMAAGNSRRFGSNKLSVKLDGLTLAEYALNVIPSEIFSSVVVVTQYPEIAEMARSRGFVVKINQEPEKGLSNTIRIGIEALLDMDALLFLVADQPMLRQETIQNVVALYRAHPDRIVIAGHEGRRGNPCIFPREFNEELLALTGDMGGVVVIKAHEDRILCYHVEDVRELIDIDTEHTLSELMRTP